MECCLLVSVNHPHTAAATQGLYVLRQPQVTNEHSQADTERQGRRVPVCGYAIRLCNSGVYLSDDAVGRQRRCPLPKSN